MTVGALRLLKEHGLRVPDDLSLVSFDDVPLFSLHEAGHHRGRAAGRQDRRDRSRASSRRGSPSGGAGHEPHTITLDCDIILRGSTRRRLTPEIGRPES